MRTRKWAGVAFMLASAVALVGIRQAQADVASDKAAAILVFPRIEVNPDQDTIVQISNTSTDTQALHCFYVNATSHCSVSERACDSIESPCDVPEGLCLPGWIETDFQIFITPRQPIAWSAREGLPGSLVPLNGVDFRGPRNESNSGTAIPPVSEEIFVGELKCIVVDPAGRAIPRNVIKGEATFVTQDPLDIEKYSAVGIQRTT